MECLKGINTRPGISSGFTMIELIVTLVLLGILGVLVLSRFLQANSFDALEARDAVIATARGAQQNALGRDGVSFRIGQAGSNWQILAYADAGLVELRQVSLPMEDVILETGSAAASLDNCASGIDDPVANDFEVSFDGFGNVESFTNNANTVLAGPSFNGVRICLNDDDSHSVCISPAGFAFAGPCDD